MDLYVVAVKDNENGFLEQYLIHAFKEDVALKSGVYRYVMEHIGSGHFEQEDLDKIRNVLECADSKQVEEYMLDWEMDLSCVKIYDLTEF